MRHPLSQAIPFVGHWLDMPAQPLSGDSFMPRVQGPSFGASERMVVSPGREAQGYFQMPGGPVDHPMSPFYGAGHKAWARGEPRPLLPGEPKHTLKLLPAAVAKQ
jgi:penicillin amidase